MARNRSKRKGKVHTKTAVFPVQPGIPTHAVRSAAEHAELLENIQGSIDWFRFGMQSMFLRLQGIEKGNLPVAERITESVKIVTWMDREKYWLKRAITLKYTTKRKIKELER